MQYFSNIAIFLQKKVSYTSYLSDILSGFYIYKVFRDRIEIIIDVMHPGEEKKIKRDLGKKKIIGTRRALCMLIMSTNPQQ